GGERADGAAGKGAGEVGVERLHDAGLGECGGDLRGDGAFGRHGQGVEGLEVQGVGDVDDHLAAQALATLGDHGADGGVGDGEDDDVAGDVGALVLAAEQLDGVAALGGDGGDGLSHVA